MERPPGITAETIPALRIQQMALFLPGFWRVTPPILGIGDKIKYMAHPMTFKTNTMSNSHQAIRVAHDLVVVFECGKRTDLRAF